MPEDMYPVKLEEIMKLVEELKAERKELRARISFLEERIANAHDFIFGTKPSASEGVRR